MSVRACVSVSVSVYHGASLMKQLHALLFSFLLPLTSYLFSLTPFLLPSSLPCNAQEDQDKVFYENLTAEESIEQGTYVLDDKRHLPCFISLYLHHWINLSSFSIYLFSILFFFLPYFFLLLLIFLLLFFGQYFLLDTYLLPFSIVLTTPPLKCPLI